MANRIGRLENVEEGKFKDNPRMGAHQMYLINYKGDKHLVGNISKDIRKQFKNIKLN